MIRLNLYSTDVDALLQHFTIATERLGDACFATTVLGVAELAG